MESRTNLLIIDDSPVDLRLLMDLMLARDLRFSVGQDGERGYNQAVLLQPDLILLDIRMPRVDGFAVCRRLKANPLTRDIPVIFLTASTDMEERLAGFSAGGVDFITKPFEPREVLARVTVHLQIAGRRAADASRVETTSIPSTPTRQVATQDEVLVSAAQKILRETIATPPSLDQLARLVGVNRRRLNDAFQQHLGQPIFGWLREERLRQAEELLLRTDSPVALISDCLGYSTPANFTKAFRDRFGVTPTEIRTARTSGANRSS